MKTQTSEEYQKSMREYEERMAAKKAEAYAEYNLPPEFVNYIESVAYDRGHSAGQGEVDSIAIGMISDLALVIRRYNIRMGIKNS